MKLSKTVKEYISEQIRIKVEQAKNGERMHELKRKEEEALEAYKKDVDAFHKKVDDEAKELCRKHGITEDFIGYHSMNCAFYLPEAKAYKKAREELVEKQRMAELNIIAEMELGGNKADLMKMLEALQF